MESLFVVLVMFVVAASVPYLCATITPDTAPCFNVLHFGATGNGQTDDSQAFANAWQEACNATHDTSTLIIPKGKTFMLQPVSFQGPCKSASVIIKLKGTITAPKSVESWIWPNHDWGAWVRFSKISGLVIYGGGQIDGQGAPWWDCFSNNKCHRPTALHFHDCENLILRRLTHINSPRNHISLNACSGAYISKLHFIAPEESPNTDAIDISESSNIKIKDSIMETGDDCIAINHGCKSISITRVFCGPGHGISVGSLGRNGAHETVEDIYVRNCTFFRTTNGARIKTWMGGRGYARKITFQDIIVVEAKNPVIIDQEYNPQDSTNAVKVSDVTFRNVRGTSMSKHAVQLHCDNNIGCTNIILEGINITSAAGEEIYASCKNVDGVCTSCFPHVPCLSEEE
ncbi:probable polygalacturonase At3g15720 [Lotus japonicus]|uniref:probable polygalacturonase At3g15720 n=1 Tax=Lotus japonicus TaxID=34305 RepID=UPI002584535A|nr:probable polygalacturonase At3g15720 [Lotus japonicus]